MGGNVGTFGARSPANGPLAVGGCIVDAGAAREVAKRPGDIGHWASRRQHSVACESSSKLFPDAPRYSECHEPLFAREARIECGPQPEIAVPIRRPLAFVPSPQGDQRSAWTVRPGAFPSGHLASGHRLPSRCLESERRYHSPISSPRRRSGARRRRRNQSDNPAKNNPAAPAEAQRSAGR
jgi:hypothetical protein